MRNSKYSPIKVLVYSGLFGDVNTIFWEVGYKDLASYEAVNEVQTRIRNILGDAEQGNRAFYRGQPS
jgi:hypothetical protein